MSFEKVTITISPIESHFPQDLYDEFVKTLFDDISAQDNPEEFIEPFVYPVENIQKIADSDNIEYKESIRAMADDLWTKEEWLSSVMVYYILMHIITFLPTDFYKLGYAFAKLGHKDLAQDIIAIYEPLSSNKKVTYHALANFYYTAIGLPYRAIEYFEKYLELDEGNALVWLSLGHCCSGIDDEISKEKQFKAYQKAYELKPDDPTIVKSLLTYYEKDHNEEKVKEFYPKLINIAPSPRHSLNYGLYLMSWGELNKGGSYFQERFDLEEYPIGYPKSMLGGVNKWNYKDDISDKTLLIHYEEGFGDTIMYSRFVPLISQFAQHTVLIVQPQLHNLFKASPVFADGVELMSDIKDFISKYKSEKYLHMPLMDTPYPLGVDTHFIPFTTPYLTAANPVQYDTDKLKVGIAYSGDISANYNGRDIEISEFEGISKLDNVQLYSLQVGPAAKNLAEILPNAVDLGKDFKDFTDTANAIMGMDLVITSDNVILNLAGALGRRTYGVFNKYPNYRWFNLNGKDVVWYESVKPFQCKAENGWSDVMKEVEASLKEEFLNG